MVKLTKRKGFNFFRSYYDVYNELETNEDKVTFIDALLDRQFLGIKPLNLKGMAKFAYISQTNSIDSQVKGYEDKTKSILHPAVGGCVGVILPPTVQVEEKEKEKEVLYVKNENKHEIFKDECLQSGEWLEVVSMKEKIPSDKIPFALNDFNKHLIINGDIKTSLKDYKYHFASWVRKMKQYKAKEETNKNIGKL
jgi:hypothetical protein